MNSLVHFLHLSVLIRTYLLICVFYKRHMFCVQVMRIADKGADFVRITVQGKKEADACFEIKNALVQRK